MRPVGVAAVALIFLLAGCSGGGATEDAVEPSTRDATAARPQGEAEPLVANETTESAPAPGTTTWKTWPINFQLGSDLALCTPGGVPAGNNCLSWDAAGIKSMTFVNATAFTFHIELADAGQVPALAERLRLVATCGKLSDTENGFPILECEGEEQEWASIDGTPPFDWTVKDMPQVPRGGPKIMAYYWGTGEEVVQGNGAGYDVTGTYTSYRIH